MRYLQFLLLTIICSVSSVLATVEFTPLDLSSASQNVSLLNGQNLTAPPPPWGPSPFDVDIIQRPIPIERTAIFMLAVQLIAQEALQDFNGKLPEAKTVYRHQNYPDLTIAVASISPIQRVQRKHLLWGIARALNHLVQKNQFLASTLTMKWQGQRVGTLFFIANSPTTTPKAGYKDIFLSGPEASQASVSDYVNGLSFQYAFSGSLLSLTGIFMGTVGALVQAAERTERIFDRYVGSFPGYEALIFYQADPIPSTLTKGVMVQTMVAGVSYSLEKRDWHELKITFSDNERQVGWGGWIQKPIPPTGADA